MNRLLPSAGADITILAAQTAAAFPPLLGGTHFGVVSSWGNEDMEKGAVGEFDLDLFAAGAVDLTNVKLYGMIPQTGTVAADDVNSVTHATEKLTVTGHLYNTGDGPFQLTTSGTLPAGYALATNYWIVVFDANTIGLASSLANAMAGTLVAITTDGTGTHTITAAAGCKLARWFALDGMVDTAISLSLRLGYRVRCAHNPRILAYALSATFSGAVATSALISAVQER
jgi:hypothetical protein